MAKSTRNATRRAILRARRTHHGKSKSAVSKPPAQGQPKAEIRPEAATALSPGPRPTPTGAASMEGTKAKKFRHRRRKNQRIRNLESSVKRLTDTLQDYKTCKVKVAEAMAELVEAKKQISELNAAVNFLLKQPPNTGSFFHEG